MLVTTFNLGGSQSRKQSPALAQEGARGGVWSKEPFVQKVRRGFPRPRLLPQDASTARSPFYAPHPPPLAPTLEDVGHEPKWAWPACFGSS